MTIREAIRDAYERKDHALAAKIIGQLRAKGRTASEMAGDFMAACRDKDPLKVSGFYVYSSLFPKDRQ